MENQLESAQDNDDRPAEPCIARIDCPSEDVPDDVLEAARQEAARDPSKRYVPMYLVFCK